MSKSKIVFVLSGSIAAFKACQVISRLVQDGHEVQTVATPSALKFVGAATLEGLTGKPVLSDLWESGRAMDHIHLSRWADFGLICPASANLCNRVAQGLGDGLVENLMLAWPQGKPIHVFPAMNLEMLRNPTTQESLSRLIQRGFTVHETAAGNLACGEEGAGRLLEPEDILKRVNRKSLGEILITSGATREPIDGIRYISNISTGQTGARLADELSAKGWSVTYVHGVGTILPKSNTRNVAYGSFSELDQTLIAELRSRDFNGVIHAAAVSDYSVSEVNGQPSSQDVKLKSERELNLKLKANFKLLPRLKEYSRSKEIKVVGFKLTLNKSEGETERMARALISESVDAVVANDWTSVNADRTKHPGVLLTTEGARPFNELNQLSEIVNELFIKGAKPI
jgi:phosphopantothenoylcysteine decarboxylase / phosphopantothenate---cysteine ligase